jgi:hypothetical protein
MTESPAAPAEHASHSDARALPKGSSWVAVVPKSLDIRRMSVNSA